MVEALRQKKSRRLIKPSGLPPPPMFSGRWLHLVQRVSELDATFIISSALRRSKRGYSHSSTGNSMRTAVTSPRYWNRRTVFSAEGMDAR